MFSTFALLGGSPGSGEGAAFGFNSAADIFNVKIYPFSKQAASK